MYICDLTMKNQSTILLFCLMTMLAGLACKRTSSGQEGTQEPPTASNPEDTAGFNNEVVQYESADRVIWQKPDLVIKQLGDVEGKVVADLGAGTGYFSRRIAYKGAKVIAIDIDPKAIQWMEEQKSRFPAELQDRLVIRLAEPNDPKLKVNEVDIVLLVNTYSYIKNRVAYFTKLKEAIQPGGHVVIIDFKKKETPFGPSLEDRVDVKTVEEELVAAGYSILAKDETSLDYQYIIKAQKN
jgi:SAM-dependent methyltransferase